MISLASLLCTMLGISYAAHAPLMHNLPKQEPTNIWEFESHYCLNTSQTK